MSEPLLDQVLRAITAVERSQPPVGPSMPGSPPDVLKADQLARRIVAIQSARERRISNAAVLICAGDHGLATADRARGEDAACRAMMGAIASGRAAVNAVARSAGATVLLVDCGVAVPESCIESPGGSSAGTPPDTIDLRIGNGTADVRHGPAMSRDDALASLDSGVALGLSLADAGIDCLALGHIAPGADPLIEIACALLCQVPFALLDPELRSFAEDLRATHASALAGEPLALAALSAFGGYEIGVMAGVILAAAARRVPVILDARGTSLAALLAARLCPAAAGYLFASHAGKSAGHQQVLFELGLTPIFELGLARGEGAGAALALPIITGAANSRTGASE